MSKAFKKEDSDQEPGADSGEELDSTIGSLPGRKNYMTPKGFERLRAELHELLHKTRPDLTQVVAWAASNGDRSENADYIYGKKRLREIDRRIRFLTKRLEIAEVIDPKTLQTDRIQFGATVTFENEDGTKKRVHIVGIDESNPSQGKISWISPLAKSLLSAKSGDAVSFRSPKGEEELEILRVEYVEIPD
jgi:transcription elongation factor GreB